MTIFQLSKAVGGLCRSYSTKNALPASTAIYFRKTKDEKRPRKYGMLAVPILAFGLGTWQLYRLKWKLGLIEERTNRVKISPLTIDELPDDLDQIRDMEYRLVKVTGTFDHDREIYLLPRSPLNSPSGGGLISSTTGHGAHVITPFRISGSNTVILIDRGWVPKLLLNPNTRKQAQVPGEVTITGALRNSERENLFSPTNQPGSRNFQIRNIAEMASALNTSPVFLDATKENDIPGGPLGGQTIVQMRNEHLNYAITWYTLSILCFVLWYYKMIKRKSFS